MKKINLKLEKIKFNKYHRSVYVIDDLIYEFENRKFLLQNSISNIVGFLNKKNLTIFDLFEKNNICKYCGKETKQSFSRKRLIVYHFCDLECQHNYINENKKEICKICNEEFYSKNKIYGTCGKQECIKQNRKITGISISETHWQKKRLNTRLENDKLLNRIYVPWNKGLRGIYSKETIEKISQGVLKQMNEGHIKKTKIEIKIENFLKEENINYKYSFIFKKRQFDFLLVDYNIIIEADGDFWHGNQNIERFKILTERQILKQKDDKIKNIIAIENGYDIIRFWEFDINNNFENVKNKIKESICKKQLQEF